MNSSECAISPESLRHRSSARVVAAFSIGNSVSKSDNCDYLATCVPQAHNVVSSCLFLRSTRENPLIFLDSISLCEELQIPRFPPKRRLHRSRGGGHHAVGGGE